MGVFKILGGRGLKEFGRGQKEFGRGLKEFRRVLKEFKWECFGRM